MTPAPNDQTRDPANDAPDIPLFRSWLAVYALVLSFFALVVVLLTVFTRVFS